MQSSRKRAKTNQPAFSTNATIYPSICATYQKSLPCKNHATGYGPGADLLEDGLPVVWLFGWCARSGVLG